jgi:hypothetical protein
MTARCRDFPGPDWPAIATSRGWVPLNDESVAQLAASAMLLACSPEHVERLQREHATAVQAEHQRVAQPR